nr:hypothetical protein [Tanacetum cinerariifolium]
MAPAPMHHGYVISIKICQFQREPLTFNSQLKKRNVVDSKNSFASVLNAGNHKPVMSSEPSPAIVLDESCVSEKNLSCSLVGKIKDINALSNLYVILANEGFDNVSLTYLGSYWVLINVESISSKEKLSKHVGVASWFIGSFQPAVAFAKIVFLCGSLANMDAEDDSSLPFKKVCVVTNHNTYINDKIKIIIKGQLYWIRVKELNAWIPKFIDEGSDTSSSNEEDIDGMNKGSNPYLNFITGGSILQVMEDLVCHTLRRGLDGIRAGGVTLLRISSTKHKERPLRAMIFKVDFEKAFDFVRWDFLDDILNTFGFGAKWRGWIQGCLNSSMGSILVNGNLMLEFKFHKRLKQGDPLSLFLFILVMESLNLSFNNILNARLFKGIRIDDSLSLSHLFYADDAILIGGRYTLTKSVLSSLPLYHMSIYKVPLGVLNNMESIRRKFFNGIDKDEKKMSMIGWNKILASKKKGVLGVSSFFALNRALLLKWIWSIIGEFHNLSHKGVNLLKLMKKKVGNRVYTRFWDDPWLFDSLLMHVFPRLYALKCAQHVTVAAKLSDSSLIDSFRRPPRRGVEEEQLLGLIDNIDSVILSNSNDRWVWSLESSGEFFVKTARSHIDDFFLPSVGDPTRWIKIVPIKINIFAWKVRLDRLPT